MISLQITVFGWTLTKHIGLKIVKNFFSSFILPPLVIFFFLARADISMADDFMAGTVLSSDIEKMEIVLVPLKKGPAADDTKEEARIIAKVSGDNLVVNRVGRKVFPGCVSPGRIIRLWGRMDKDRKVFYVNDLRGWGGRGRHDPTGVRRRLQRGGGWNCQNGPGFHGGQK